MADDAPDFKDLIEPNAYDLLGIAENPDSRKNRVAFIKKVATTTMIHNYASFLPRQKIF